MSKDSWQNEKMKSIIVGITQLSRLSSSSFNDMEPMPFWNSNTDVSIDLEIQTVKHAEKHECKHTKSIQEHFRTWNVLTWKQWWGTTCNSTWCKHSEFPMDTTGLSVDICRKPTSWMWNVSKKIRMNVTRFVCQTKLFVLISQSMSKILMMCFCKV